MVIKPAATCHSNNQEKRRKGVTWVLLDPKVNLGFILSWQLENCTVNP